MQHKVKMTIGNRRGTLVNYIFAISSMRCGEVIEMDPVFLWSWAVIGFKFAMTSEYFCALQPSIKFKKRSQAKDHIGIKIRSLNFKKKSICGSDWSEYINMGPPQNINYCRIPCFSTHEHPFLTIFKVNITVKMLTPNPLSVNRGLYNDVAFTDFELKGEDGYIPCHRAILVTHSSVFRAMLNRDWQEAALNTMVIAGVTKQTLQYLKDYMYLRTLPNDTLQLQSLLTIADMYLIDNLKFRCIARMVELVTPDNFDQIIEYACRCNVPDLIKALVISIPDRTVDGIMVMNYTHVEPTVQV